MTTSTPSLSSIMPLLTKTVGIVEKLLVLLPLLLIPAGVFVWGYLKSLGWSSLFLRSALDGSALLLFVLGSVFFVAVVFALFVAPSLLMRFHGDLYDDGAVIPGNVAVLQRWTLGSWLLAFALIAPRQGPEWIVVAIPIAVATAYAVWRRHTLALGAKASTALIHVPIALLTALCSVFPLQVIFTVLAQYSQFIPDAWVYAVIPVAILGTIPGFVYLGGRVKHASRAQAAQAAKLSAVVLACVITLLFALIDPARQLVLKGIDFYSEKPLTFHVTKPELSSALRAAGLAPSPLHGGEIITAYVAYRFGSVILLCRETPAALLARKGDDKGSGCVPAATDELRELRLPPTKP